MSQIKRMKDEMQDGIKETRRGLRDGGEMRWQWVMFT